MRANAAVIQPLTPEQADFAAASLDLAYRTAARLPGDQVENRGLAHFALVEAASRPGASVGLAVRWRIIDHHRNRRSAPVTLPLRVDRSYRDHGPAQVDADDLLADLSLEDRELAHLLCQRFTQAEVAARLQTPINVIYTRIYRLRSKLRKRFAPCSASASPTP